MIKISKMLVRESIFSMGADPDREIDADYEEKPQIQVKLSDYEIQTTPVTVKMWKEFLEDSGYQWNYIQQVLEVSCTENSPITYVSWYDATEFTDWLCITTGKKYSLPTEAQWEKACRGIDKQLFPWGNDEPDWSEEILLYSSARNQTVGSRREWKSPYGCLDMWQNVAEWCLDWFDDEGYHRYSSEVVENPSGPLTGTYKVFRGGNPLMTGWPRCTYRGFQYPNHASSLVGFRVVVNLG